MSVDSSGETPVCDYCGGFTIDLHRRCPALDGDDVDGVSGEERARRSGDDAARVAPAVGAEGGVGGRTNVTPWRTYRVGRWYLFHRGSL